MRNKASISFCRIGKKISYKLKLFINLLNKLIICLCQRKENNLRHWLKDFKKKNSNSLIHLKHELKTYKNCLFKPTDFFTTTLLPVVSIFIICEVLTLER